MFGERITCPGCGVFYHDDEELRTDRLIAHIDVDCFSVQVDLRKYPQFKNRPCASVHKTGRIISVNYPAKKRGVTKEMTRTQAEDQCPDMHFFELPMKWGKSNTLKYIKAGDEVLDVVLKFAKEWDIIVEKNSNDDVYLDLTKEVMLVKKKCRKFNLPYPGFNQINSVVEAAQQFPLGTTDRRRNDGEYKNTHLFIGAKLVKKIRREIFTETGFYTSAGISYNKLLAKLACNLNKPKKQTVFFDSGIERVFDDIEVKNVDGLGGFQGEEICEFLEDCGLDTTIGCLAQICFSCLQSIDEDRAEEWYLKSRGIDHRSVKWKTFSKKLTSGKEFHGSNRPDHIDDVEQWTEKLCGCLNERLNYHLTRCPNRVPSQVKAEFYFSSRNDRKVTVAHCYNWRRLARDIIDEAFPRGFVNGKVEEIRLTLSFDNEESDFD